MTSAALELTRQLIRLRLIKGLEPELSATGGTSDDRLFIAPCPQVLEFGPVNASIHKLNEHVEIDALDAFKSIYRQMLECLLLPGLNPDRPVTLRAVLRETVTQFKRAGLAFGHGTHNARDEAIYLILHTLKLPLDELDSVLDRRLSSSELDAVHAILRRRVKERTPAAYLTREAWLGEFRFYVDERVIVPRSFIAELLRDGLAPWVADARRVRSVLDLCTGSGCLAVLAAHAFPKARVDAADLSADALQVARRNVKDYALGKRVRLVQTDLFDRLAARRYDLILSNPPYVNAAAMRALPREYRREPRLALAGGRDGLVLAHRMLAQAADHLNPEGLLIVEIGHNRAALEKAYPRLPFVWLATSAGEDYVFLLHKEDLP